MKKQLSQGAVIGTLIGVGVVVAIIAFFVFKSGSSGPPVTPAKFKPPAGFDANRFGSGAGKPMGAPANAGGPATNN